MLKIYRVIAGCVAGLCFIPLLLQAQYQANGTAVQLSPQCYRLTTNVTNQAGSVWYLNRVNINQPFDLYFNVMVGCSDIGADGMAFVLQPISTNVGTAGGGLGYQGITPSFVVEFDTYQNTNSGDPSFDHVAIMSNGSVDHTSPNNLAGPVAAQQFLANIEDCMNHVVRFTWDPATTTFRVYFDCVLRLTYVGNIVQNIFGGNPMVYWGWTAATGALTNEHRFCLNYISFNQALRDTAICRGDTVQLNVGTGSAFSWTPAAGLSATNIANPRAFPQTTTTYIATVTDACNQPRVDTVRITVGDTTALRFSLGRDTLLCGGDSLPLNYSRSGVNFLWQNSSTLPAQTLRTPGLYWLQLSNACGIRRDSIQVGNERQPQVNIGPPDTLVCNRAPLNLDATFISLRSPTRYLWDNAHTGPTRTVNGSGTYWVRVENDCGVATDTIRVEYAVAPSPVSLGGPITILCVGDTLQLNAGYQPGVQYRWSTGSTDTAISVTNQGTYRVDLSNRCGALSASVQVDTLSPPRVNLGPDIWACDGDTVTLVVNTSPVNTIFWGNGRTGSPLIVPIINCPGDERITVIVLNTCGSVTDSLVIRHLDPPVWTPLPDTLVCPGEAVTVSLNAAMAAGFRWFDGDSSRSRTFTAPGSYNVSAWNFCGSTLQTFRLRNPAPVQVSLGPDRLLCDGATWGVDLSQPGWTYRWNDGNTSAVRSLTGAGLYWVEVSDGCTTDRDSMRISTENTPDPFSLGPDVTLCRGEVLRLDISAPNAQYRWSNGSTGPRLNTTQAGLIWGQRYNACGAVSDTMRLNYVDPVRIELGADRLLCQGQSLLLNAAWPGASYRWQDGSTQPTFTARESGRYFVTATNACGPVSDSVNLTFDASPAFFSLGPDQTRCIGDSVLLSADIAATPTAPVSYRWFDGTTIANYSATQSGRYWVEVSNRCGTRRDTVFLTFEQLPDPDLGPDTLRCPEERMRVDVSWPNSSYRWHDGFSSPVRYLESAGTYWVDVRNVCGTASDSVRLSDTDCSCTLFAPSAFSPNNDGHNDHFQVFHDCILTRFDVRIYNRWGQLMHQSADPAFLWDGRSPQGGIAPEGVYVWIITYEGFRNKINLKYHQQGTVTVIR